MKAAVPELTILASHLTGNAAFVAQDETVRIESDPNAAPFYRKMGACETGSVRSTIIEGRVLPVFEIALR
jgi:hypothetical protein